VQVIDESVVKVVNARTNAVLGRWTAPIKQLGRTGRQLKMIERKIIEGKVTFHSPKDRYIADSCN
jgi:hypothetical protein